MVGEQASIEESVATFDGAVERFSKGIETLVEEKKALETHVETGRRPLKVEKTMRKKLEEDVVWFLQKGVVRVMDKVVESANFLWALGV